MYLPLAGYDPEREKHRRNMSVNSISSVHNSQIIQPVTEAAKAHPQTERVQDSSSAPAQKTTEKQDEPDSQFVQDHYAAPSLSTQDFMVLKAQGHDDQFQALDFAIEKIKENADQMGDVIEALHKMSKMADKDNLALQVLTKTLEAIDEVSGEK